MQRRVKIAFLCFNLFLTASILIAHRSSPDRYYVNFYDLLPLGGWVVLILLVGLALYLIASNLYAGVYASSFVAATLILLPTLITGMPYGTDTFNKAGHALARLQGIGELQIFYPGMTEHAAVIMETAAIEPITVGPQIAVALLSPVAAVTFARSLNLSKLPTRGLLAASMLGPLGFGVYLSTLSTFHPYYLSIPLGVLFIGVVIKTAQAGTSMRLGLLVLGLGFVLLLHHPLSFVTAAAVATFLYLALVIEEPSLQQLKAPEVRQIAILFLPFGVYLIYFSFGSAGAFFLVNLLSVLRLTTAAPTGESVSAVCHPSATYVNHCGALWPGRILTTLVVFGAALAIAWTIGFDTIREKGLRAFENRENRLLLATILIAGGLMAVFASGVLGRNIMIRLLPYCALASVAAIGVGLARVNKTTVSTLGHGGFYAGVLIGGVTTAFLATIDVRMAAIAAVILVSAFAGGSVIRISATRRKQIGAVLIGVLAVASMVSLYPAPQTNTLPNQAAAPGTDAQYDWVVSYTDPDAQVAAGQMEWRRYRYANPGDEAAQFKGSQWIFSQIPLTEDQRLVRAGNNFAGVKTEIPPKYIIYRPFYQHYTKLVYKEDGDAYQTIMSVTPEDIEEEYSEGGKVYTNGNGAVYNNE